MTEPELTDDERLEAVQRFVREEMLPQFRRIMWTCAAVGALSALAFNLLLLSVVAAAR